MSYSPDYKFLPPLNIDFLTPVYDFFCWITGLGPKFKEKILRTTNIRDHSLVADIGCGTGIFLKIAKEKYPNAKFIGIDPDEKSLEIAKKRLKKANLEVELQKAFAEGLPLQDASVDLVFSTLAFHHMPDRIKEKAIEEMYRILKKNGKVIITDFGKSNSVIWRKMMFWEDIEYLEGNLKGLIEEHLVKTGFRIEKITNRKFPNIYTIIAEKL